MESLSRVSIELQLERKKWQELEDKAAEEGVSPEVLILDLLELILDDEVQEAI